MIAKRKMGRITERERVKTILKFAIALGVLLGSAGVWAQGAPKWVIGRFTRPATGNPVVSPNPASTFEDPILHKLVAWEALHTFNPAAIVRRGKIYVLYRAEDNSGAMEIGGHTSRLGLAESSDGIHFKRLGEPVFYPADDDQKAREWPGGVEDPRIVERDDGTYVLTYTQWNRKTYSVGIATSRDLKHWTKYGPAFLTALGGKYANLMYKSAGIVTQLKGGRLIAAKIAGRYWMYWGEGSVKLATSDDAIHWIPVEDMHGKLVELLRPRAGHFDSTFPETGPPPVLTSAGIVMLYNGKNATEGGGDPALGPNAYAAGEALFETSNPANLLSQIDEPVLMPELPYEKTGQYAAGTTFAEGLVFFHGKWFLYYGCADSLVAVATAPAEAMSAESLRMAPSTTTAPGTPVIPSAGVAPPGAEANARGFYLHGGDTVVFYGDSITEQNYYNQYVELYTATRFPWMRVHFYGAGVGGDRVTGGGGGPIDQRLERDVFSEKPTVVTVMLGMNDGGYQATTDEIEQTYVKGYEHLLDSIREHVPGARLTLLGPSPYDDVTRPVTFPGGYNAVMRHFADVDQSLADKYGAAFVNLNPPVITAIRKADAMDRKLAVLLLPDRVHPDPLAHWVMAEALLKGWHAPALVSDVTVDAHAGVVTQARNASVGQVEQTDGAWKWTEVEDALPLPLTRSNATQALLEDLTDIEQQLNQETLRVTGLAAGQYRLSIDGDAVDTFSPDALENGINLADYGTAMFHQAQRVSWLVRDRDETHYIHLRMRVRNADSGAEEGKDVMQAFENSLEDSIYEAAVPKPHVFRLTPVATGTSESTR
ncbi:MAG: GDSL-type esterase/lipase family protein [Terracidiphilus sp.]